MNIWKVFGKLLEEFDDFLKKIRGEFQNQFLKDFLEVISKKSFKEFPKELMAFKEVSEGASQALW